MMYGAAIYVANPQKKRDFHPFEDASDWRIDDTLKKRWKMKKCANVYKREPTRLVVLA